ncbi:hypothetical protein [Saccharopolyspora griseoalba]|uniref:Uncharacterized protein n=1 Tax=Saccharopolyspora griseoalba TaxID=1431848 RepID=A0ABW2LF09_9PSEU
MISVLGFLSAAGSITGLGFLAAMIRSSNTFLGVIALLIISATGLPTIAYGMLTSM